MNFLQAIQYLSAILQGPLTFQADNGTAASVEALTGSGNISALSLLTVLMSSGASPLAMNLAAPVIQNSGNGSSPILKLVLLMDAQHAGATISGGIAGESGRQLNLSSNGDYAIFIAWQSPPPSPAPLWIPVATSGTFS